MGQITVDKIIEGYENSVITKNEAIVSSRLIIDFYPYGKVDDIVRALFIVVNLSKKDKKLFKYLEHLAICDNWSKVRMNAILLICKYYSKKAWKIVKYILQRERKIAYYFIYYFPLDKQQLLAKIIKEPELKKVYERDIKIPTKKAYLYYYYKKLGRVD